MEGTGKLRLVSWLIVAGLVVAPVSTALASQPGAVAAALVEESSYRHYLDDMLYTHYGDDRWWGPEHDLAQANIKAIMEGFGLSVALEPVLVGEYTFYNVVGTKLGTVDPDLEYVVGAHYDSCNYSDFAEFGAPGADDNASGVALVLEAARILTEYDSDYTIRFVAFDREEQGLYGSWAYAIDHFADNIVGMINADMIAFNIGTDTIDLNITRSSSEPLQDALELAFANYGDGVGWNKGYGGSSDHAPFEQVGFQAVCVIEDWGNPCWHYGCDSIDTPDYIDYELAVKGVRGVVGFLAEHAGVQVDLPDADYDTDGDVDMDDYAEFDACFAGPDVPVDPPCDFFDLDGDGDVDCADWRLFRAVWTGLGGPPVHWACYLPPPMVEAESSRSLAVMPPEHGIPMALLVEGDPDDPNVSCLSQYVQDDGTLGTTPVFRAYDTWGTVIVHGEAIVPGTNYRVWCDYGEPGYSPVGTPVTTGLWGDVVGDFYQGHWTPPNGRTDFIDIAAIVGAFKSDPTAPPVSWVDLVGQSGSECIPDLAIDFLDISADVAAFKGYSFWETTGCSSPCD